MHPLVIYISHHKSWNVYIASVYARASVWKCYPSSILRRNTIFFFVLIYNKFEQNFRTRPSYILKFICYFLRDLLFLCKLKKFKLLDSSQLLLKLMDNFFIDIFEIPQNDLFLLFIELGPSFGLIIKKKEKKNSQQKSKVIYFWENLPSSYTKIINIDIIIIIIII